MEPTQFFVHWNLILTKRERLVAGIVRVCFFHARRSPVCVPREKQTAIPVLASATFTGF
jgi:hypothetical protein